jgi:Ca2+-binding RTX toxin-like protein
MAVGRGAALLVTVGLFLAVAPAIEAAVRSAYVAASFAMQGTLRVESDEADSIVASCIGGRVQINGAPPDTGPLECFRANRIEIVGGPGDNRIDLSAIAPAQSFVIVRGVAAYATIEGRAGNDVIVGPSSGLVRLVGGAGSDWLQGQSDSIDTYIFGPAAASERDTIVEPATSDCDPSYGETNQPGRSNWTVPWDAVDFSDLTVDDRLIFDERAPNGVLASHRNRFVLSARPRPGTSVTIEAVRAGPADDRLTASCMAVGGEGNDVVAAAGADGALLIGGIGDDKLTGGRGPDRLYGASGVDDIDGGAGADVLVGARGNDLLTGGRDGDVYLFGAVDSSQEDVVREASGSGNDVLSFDFEADAPVVADLSTRSPVVARARGFQLRAEPGTARFIEGLIGTKGNDHLTGNDGSNHFWSGGGTDLVAGRRGNDVYHVDWTASMPFAVYDWGEVWVGPFNEVAPAGRSIRTVRKTPRSRLRIQESARSGLDTVNVAERWFSHVSGRYRLEGQIKSGVRADLSAPVWIVNAGRVGALTAKRGGSRHLEGLRGTAFPDKLIGNAAANILEGRQDHDRLLAGSGKDLCVTALTSRDRDVLSGCERTRRADPDR